MDAGLYLEGEERFGFITSALYSKFSGISSKRLYGAVLEKIQRFGPKRILDVGCGPGDILIRISEEFKELELYGVDPSPYMVNIARKKIVKSDYEPAIRIDLGSSRSVPFKPNFDMIITSLSYHHWKEQREGLEYLLGLLNESGILVIIEFNPEKYPARLPFMRDHTLSRENAERITFNGFERYIELSADMKLLMVIFRKLPE